MTATDEELRDLFAQLIDNDRREGISPESTADGLLAFAKLGRAQVLAAAAELDQLREQLQESREANRALRDDNQSLSLANRELDRNLRNEQRRTNRAKEQWITAWEAQQAAEKERDQLRAQLAAVASVRVWRNEDSKGFLFADEVSAALGLSPEEPFPAALRAAGLDPATIPVHATPKET